MNISDVLDLAHYRLSHQERKLEACKLIILLSSVTWIIQQAKINVVMFYTDKSIPEGSEIPLSQWVMPSSTQEILEVFDDCGPEVKKLLSLVGKPNKWAIHNVDPTLDSFSRGTVALIGDAAHGMCPHLGAGVGQGLEDVQVICRLLTHPQTRLSNVKVRLQCYYCMKPVDCRPECS